MKYFIGIDLGTTNSAISFYDGEKVQLVKSKDQSDVTPSAIHIDKRGNKHIGRRAYDIYPIEPKNTAVKFKKLIGTSTKFNLGDLEMTPEECSAEILKTLFGSLKEEIRNDPDIGTVITVPAAFNQMQKDATMAAAELSGIGKVALMQEPVAAVMSEMKVKKTDGIFLVYDLGGGTLDIAIASSTKNRITLLSHGGIPMCGGTDFDRTIFDNIVKPWLVENFKLPQDFEINPDYEKLRTLALFATEQAKIVLSSEEETTINWMGQSGIVDEEGKDIYIDIIFSRKQYDKLIAERVESTIKAARDAIKKASLNISDIERLVFVGGPTQYKPLRDLVSFELGVEASTDVNPMTAVSEGAAIFAESINWESKSRGRKSSRGKVSVGGKLDLDFNFVSRTPDLTSKIGIKSKGTIDKGIEFQIDSLDTGWSSGKSELKDGAIIKVDLTKSGENTFKVFVYDQSGGQIKIDNDKIIINRTAASMDAIPASSSIGIEVLENDTTALVYLVKQGDSLPKKGSEIFKANEVLKAGDEASLNFILREGEIENPVTDNQFIGDLKISGTEFESGQVNKGDEIVCEYEVLDSGQLILNVTISSIRFNTDKSLYSRQEGQIDFSNAKEIITDEADNLDSQIEEISNKVDDPELEDVKEKVATARGKVSEEKDPELSKQALEELGAVKKILSKIRKNNESEVQQLELDHAIKVYKDNLSESENIKPSERTTFDALALAAQKSIDTKNKAFPAQLDGLNALIQAMLTKQDWFIVDVFKAWSATPHAFSDQAQFNKLVEQGNDSIERDDINGLRDILGKLSSLRIPSSGSADIYGAVNIVRG
jgi:molecular chaperone DnaK